MSEEKVLTKKELESALFSAADALRSKMERLSNLLCK